MLDLIVADGDFSAPANAVRPVKPQDGRDSLAETHSQRGPLLGSPGRRPCDCFKALG